LGVKDESGPLAAERKNRPKNARLREWQFKKGNAGRPKGILNERAKVGQEAAAALEVKAWDVLERLLSSPSWRARHEAAKVVLAYAIGLPRQTLVIAGGFGDLSRELAAALAEARVRRAALDASHETIEAAASQAPTTVSYPTSEPAELEADTAPLQEAPGGAIAADDVEAGHESASATGAQDAAAPGTVAPDPEGGFFS